MNRYMTATSTTAATAAAIHLAWDSRSIGRKVIAATPASGAKIINDSTYAFLTTDARSVFQRWRPPHRQTSRSRTAVLDPPAPAAPDRRSNPPRSPLRSRRRRSHTDPKATAERPPRVAGLVSPPDPHTGNPGSTCAQVSPATVPAHAALV